MSFDFARIAHGRQIGIDKAMCRCCDGVKQSGIGLECGIFWSIREWQRGLREPQTCVILFELSANKVGTVGRNVEMCGIVAWSNLFEWQFKGVAFWWCDAGEDG